MAPSNTGGGSTPPTVTITANPTSVASGGSSTLTVSATNATQVTVTGTDGSTYTLSTTGGTQSVKPTVTTTYTATATGAGGKITAAATVTVGAAPVQTVTITANPTSVTAGSSSILTVMATNSTQVTITGSDGSSYTLSPTGGTQSVTPTLTTTYTATATGGGGKVTAAATVTVTANPAPTVTITDNPTSITAGSSSILTVTATSATGVTITGGGSTYTLTPTGGAQAVSPITTTTYTATATGPGGTITATTSLTVTPNPAPTVTMTASPTSIVSGSSSTLTVSSTYATQVTITGGGSTYTLMGTSGLQTVSPTATTTYTATATGPGGTSTETAIVTVEPNPTPTVSIAANPTTIVSGSSSTLTVTATNATGVTVTGTDGSSYTLTPSGGTQAVTPTATTTYTAVAAGTAGNVSMSTTVTVNPPGSVDDIDHVIFMMQENRTFDSYFGMLNSYRNTMGYNVGADGNTYNVDGIDTIMNAPPNMDDQGTVYPLFKLASTCVDDMSSAWLESYGDVNTYNFAANRPIDMGGFVHTAEGFAVSCNTNGGCSGAFTDTTGQRAMGYYDQGFLNYYYYMASQFALSDRWFSPVSSKTVDNRIATFTGGTTQGLTKDPGSDDKLGQLAIEPIFQELDNAGVSWKIYYTVTQGACTDEDDCSGGASNLYPATNFSALQYSQNYLREMPASGVCPPPTQPSSVVQDNTNSFCIDPTHIAPLSDPNYGYFNDLQNGTLPSFAFIEPGYSVNDEHPSSGGNILPGQQEVATIVNAFMASTSWNDSVFFLAYDEGGGPYDHVPPVPGYTNEYTNTTLVAATPSDPLTDISSIAVNPDETGPNETAPDEYNPCLPPTAGTATLHCDLATTDPGAVSTDAAANPDLLATGRGFAAQLGFRVPNMVISPFARAHYVSHIPMDHTAIIKFVENRFIGPNAHLTARDAAQPNLLNFFDFNGVPWATPPTPPTPDAQTGLCTPASMGP